MASPTTRKAPTGIDGRIPFKPDGKTTKFAVVSVKGGKLKTDDVRALVAVAKREAATSLGFGMLVTLNAPTIGMKADAASAGATLINGKSYPLVQILTVEDILKRIRPRLPLVDSTVAYRKSPGIQPKQGEFPMVAEPPPSGRRPAKSN